MSVFQTSNHRGERFTINPVARRNQYNKGWVIFAQCDDATLYSGHYVMAVGWADDVRNMGPNSGHIAFRLKRHAVASIKEAIDLGILKIDEARK
jgi:hypothetical protein